jgi:hypothetical protein
MQKNMCMQGSFDQLPNVHVRQFVTHVQMNMGMWLRFFYREGYFGLKEEAGSVFGREEQRKKKKENGEQKSREKDCSWQSK